MGYQCVAFCALLTAVCASVQGGPLRDAFTYQGELMEDGGAADGVYDFVFTMYDAPTSGTQIASVNGDDVIVIDGRFSQYLDFGPGGALFTNDERWLEIEVRNDDDGAYSLLGTRSRIAPTPMSLYALKSGMSLQSVYRNGSTVTTLPNQPTIRFGASPNTTDIFNLMLGHTGGRGGIVSTYDGVHDMPRAVLGTSPQGSGYLLLSQPWDFFTPFDGIPHFDAFYDPAGESGVVRIARNATGAPGFILEGSHGSTNSPRLQMLGGSSPVSIRTDITGDDAVVLPVGGVSSAEMSNEAGIVMDTGANGYSFSTNPNVYTNIASVSIAAPSDGYVLVMANAELSMTHIQSLPSFATVGLSRTTTSTEHESNQVFHISYQVNASGRYQIPITTQMVFPVSAGTHTFYFNGNQDYVYTSASARARNMTALFVPTAYGSVSATMNGTDSGAFPPSDQRTLQKQNAAFEADAARQRQELEEMRARLERLEKAIED